MKSPSHYLSRYSREIYCTGYEVIVYKFAATFRDFSKGLFAPVSENYLYSTRIELEVASYTSANSIKSSARQEHCRNTRISETIKKTRCGDDTLLDQ